MTKKWKLEIDVSYKGWEVIQYVLDLQSDFYTGLSLKIIFNNFFLYFQVYFLTTSLAEGHKKMVMMVTIFLFYYIVLIQIDWYFWILPGGGCCAPILDQGGLPKDFLIWSKPYKYHLIMWIIFFHPGISWLFLGAQCPVFCCQMPSSVPVFQPVPVCSSPADSVFLLKIVLLSV